MRTCLCIETVSNSSLNQNTSLEDFINRGIMDERDIDYLNHIKIAQEDISDVALEGIIRAVVHDNITRYSDGYREIKGWFLGIESKRKYIAEVCDDLVDWLKDKDDEYKDLDLDMGSFKTWMKTSENFYWRYYFLLHNETWNKIESDLKSGKISGLETIYNIDFKDRKSIANDLDSVSDIKGLIKVAELYKARSNKFFELIIKRKITIKQTPFQVILLGFNDLRRTLKKIVNLAI